MDELRFYVPFNSISVISGRSVFFVFFFVAVVVVVVVVVVVLSIGKAWETEVSPLDPL